MRSRDFPAWLASASEDDKRAASEYRHHYPVEQSYWDVDDEDHERRRVVCGCNEKMGYPLGHHETEN